MSLLKHLNSAPAADGQAEASGGEVISPQVQANTVRKTTVMLIAAIAAAFIIVFIMHKKDMPKQASAAVSDQQLVIETAIAQLTGINQQSVNQVDRLVGKFYEFADFKQIQPAQLKKEPFSSFLAAEENQKITDVFKQLPEMSMQLMSIMQSENGNCCMIDDVLLYEGDEINGFKVVQIGVDFVKLISGSKQIILYIEPQ